MKNNYCENLKMLRSCQRFYKITFLVYFFTCIPYAAATFIYALLHGFTTKENLIPKFALSVLLALLLFSAGLLSIYKKELKYTWTPIGIMALFVPQSQFVGNLLMDIVIIIFPSISIASSVLLAVVHKKYRWLEQQERFPYFNERFEENKNKLNEYINDNPYQRTMEKYKNSSSGKMNDI